MLQRRVFFNSAEYERLIEHVQSTLNNSATSLHCKLVRCSAANKKGSRCGLCCGASRAGTGLCHHHVHKRLNRRGQLVLGFDKKILTDPECWLADDGVETAAIVGSELAKKRKITVDFLGDGKIKRLFSSEGRRRVVFVLLNRHWFLLHFLDSSDKVVVHDSLKPQTADMQDLQAQRIINRLLEAGETLPRVLEFDEHTPRQLNANDCGFFAINEFFGLLRNGIKLTNDPTKIRDAVIRTLIIRNF